MNLSQLRYVWEVEKAGSITQAAKNLYMGQPNLSRAIRELEKEIGITLFHRTPQGVEPTEQGARFLTYAKTILSQMDELESLYKHPQAQELRFRAAVPRTAYLPAAFADFLCGLSPEARLEVHYEETSSMAALSKAASGEADLAVLRIPRLPVYEEYYAGLLQNARLRQDPLWEFRMCLLMSEQHPLAGCGEIPYHLLDGYTELCYSDVQAAPFPLNGISREAVLKKPRRKIFLHERGGQFELLRRIPGSYMWDSPVPPSMLAANGLVMKECPHSSCWYQDVLVYKEGHALTSLEEQFAALARQYALRIPR